MGETENQHPFDTCSFLEVFITNLEGVGKVHSSFCCTKDECTYVGPDQELDDGGVRFILLRLRHPQQAGQETVPLVHSVAWIVQEIW